MARGRMIARTLGTSSKKFARLRDRHPQIGLFAQALYPLLVANADDFGRMDGDAFAVKHAVWSTAPETEQQFSDALSALHEEGLILRYRDANGAYAQIVDFDRHQVGLQKRTNSRFPAPSEKSMESQGNSLLREEKRTEEKRTEGNGREPRAASPPRPRTFGRIDLHRWQLDSLIAMLGPHAATFDLDAWVLELSQAADRQGLVLTKQTLWPWVQAQLRDECQRRGLPMAVASEAPALGKQSARLIAAVANLEG